MSTPAAGKDTAQQGQRGNAAPCDKPLSLLGRHARGHDRLRLFEQQFKPLVLLMQALELNTFALADAMTRLPGRFFTSLQALGPKQWDIDQQSERRQSPPACRADRGPNARGGVTAGLA